MKKIVFLRQLLLIVAFAFSSSLLLAQNETNYWAFGVGAGVQFDATFPHEISATTSDVPLTEGVASMCDASGEMLFYTNGELLWNSVLGPEIITTGLFGNSSATQSTIIVPDPGITGEYYIFTVDKVADANGLQFAKYALGATLSAPSILLQTPVCEKITSVKKGDDSGYWVLAHLWGNNSFVVYEVDCSGVNFHSIQSVGAPHQGHVYNSIGHMKFNANGTKLAVVNFLGNYAGAGSPSLEQSYGFVQVFDFNNITGIISGVDIVNIGSTDGLTDNGELLTPYGLEFSKNSEYLYISEFGRSIIDVYPGRVFQYDFSIDDKTIIGEVPGDVYDLGALQMGRDGKIYLAIYNETYLGVINTPEIALADGSVDFSNPANQMDLGIGNNLTVGLPNFVTSLFADGSISVSNTECSPYYTFGYAGTATISSYFWNFGDGETSTEANPTHLYEIGTYFTTLTIITDAGCTFTFSTDVIVESCCPILTGIADVVYHSIDETITTNQYWTGTHYVEEGVIITVATGASLDITNVDVIFGECAGIDFLGNAEARINNSVLRTCDTDKTWRGLYFFPADIGGGPIPAFEKPNVIINETTFKNAQVGVHFVGDPITKVIPLDMKVTNNLFFNNQIGVYIKNTVFNENITGNTFMVEDEALFARTACDGLTSLDKRYGVYFWNVDATGKMGQNDFICARSNSNLKLTGIELNGSTGNISDNNFSNNYCAINVRFGSHVEIEHNEITISADHYFNIDQISIYDCDFAHIRNNQLSNGNHADTSILSGSQSAISISHNSNSIWVKENEIKGFESGIYIEESDNVIVVENDILNSWYYGIYLRAGKKDLISCNTINMFNVPTADVTGIAYYQAGTADGYHKIYSNCIVETNQAIHLENTSGLPTTCPMPDIKNNFMYSYTRAGVENLGMTGAIGTSGTAHSNAGRNSFISNNAPNQTIPVTGDIISNVIINQNGNYGVLLSTASVMGGANASDFHSTASCGAQNKWGNNYPNEMDEAEICDEYSFAVAGMFKSVAGNEQVKEEVYESISEVSKALFILVYINANNPEILEETLDNIKTKSALYDEELQVLDYYYFVLTNQFEAALAMAELVDSESISEQEIAYIQFMVDNISWFDLSEEQQQNFTTATNLLAPLHIQNAEIIRADEVSLTIYPNPTQGNITVKLNMPAENADIKIFDVNGKLLEIQNIQAKNSLLQLDVNHLAAGLYFVVVEADGIITQGKFSKN